MKTLILFATKHGAAEEIAKKIAGHIDNAETFNLKNENLPKISDYDQIIIGSSIYAGNFRKEAKAFLTQNTDELSKKKLALFASGMGEPDNDEAFKSNVPEAILQASTVSSILGGIYDPKKFNFFERLIMKIVTKQSGYFSNITDEKIKKFIEAL